LARPTQNIKELPSHHLMSCNAKQEHIQQLTYNKSPQTWLTIALLLMLFAVSMDWVWDALWKQQVDQG